VLVATAAHVFGNAGVKRTIGAPQQVDKPFFATGWCLARLDTFISSPASRPEGDSHFQRPRKTSVGDLCQEQRSFFLEPKLGEAMTRWPTKPSK
jgi:hypothetical protein